jgi:hypothetical protein
VKEAQCIERFGWKTEEKIPRSGWKDNKLIWSGISSQENDNAI